MDNPYREDTFYLGDGAYLTYNGLDFIIWCERPSSFKIQTVDKHWVALDYGMIKKLKTIADDMLIRRSDDVLGDSGVSNS